nr:hypothetical protein [Klebsiella quasipneumoniae]
MVAGNEINYSAQDADI